jgi:hypothetical protein
VWAAPVDNISATVQVTLIRSDDRRLLDSGTDGQMIYRGDINANLLDIVRYAFMQPSGEGDSMCHRCAVFEYDEANGAYHSGGSSEK